MKPSAYASYKPSGVEWLGDIPSHWQPKRMRFLLTQKLQYGANEAAELDDPELPRYVRITDIDEQGTLREETFRSLPVEIAKPYLLKDGDILFARSGATSGKTFLYRNSWGTCAYAGYLIRARLNQGKMLPSFLRYFTASANYWQWLSSSTIQATIQNVSAEKYTDLWLTYPPIAEQQTIADFLDAQTAKIDTLLAKKRLFIAKLKEKRSALIARTVTRGLPPDAAKAAGLESHPAMKDSGVEWLDKMPTHWDAAALRWMSRRYSGGTPDKSNDSYWEEGEIPWLNSGAVNDGYITEPSALITQEGFAKSSAKWIPKGALVMALAGQGKTKGMVAQLGFQTTCNQSMAAIIPDHRLDPRYLYWWLSANYQNIRNMAGGEARDGLNLDLLGSIQCPLPPVIEQRAIATYLDRETARIDQLAAKVEAAIARLTEYRQALITAAVTGKIDVRARSVG